jgi:hypothetical protein
VRYGEGCSIWSQAEARTLPDRRGADVYRQDIQYQLHNHHAIEQRREPMPKTDALSHWIIFVRVTGHWSLTMVGVRMDACVTCCHLVVMMMIAVSGSLMLMARFFC